MSLKDTNLGKSLEQPKEIEGWAIVDNYENIKAILPNEEMAKRAVFKPFKVKHLKINIQNVAEEIGKDLTPTEKFVFEMVHSVALNRAILGEQKINAGNLFGVKNSRQMK